MKKKIISLAKNKFILTIIMAIISYVTLCKQDTLPSYNLQSWLIFILLFIIYYKSIIKEINNKSHLIIISMILSIMMVCGRILYAYMSNPYISFWKELFSLRSLVFILGNFNLIYIILINLIPKLCNISANVILDKNKKHNSKIVFILTFLIVFICWLPYFFSFFPGTVSPDSLSEIEIILNNYNVIYDQHTIAHLLFISGPFKLGMKIFNNINLAVSLVTITQMIILSLIIAYLIKFLYDHNVKNYILIVIVAYFGLLPMHGLYSIVMWKDVLFSGLLLLLTIQTLKLFEKKTINIKNSIPFIIVSILTLFFRNNAIYMFFIYAVGALIVFRKFFKQFLIIFLIIFGFYFSIKGPVYSYFNVIKSSSSEYIAMPLQQIGRMAFKNINFSQKEKQMLNKIMPINELKNNYSPISVDSIKFNKNFNWNYFNKHKLKYLKIWLQLVLKHPGVAVESYLTSTLGYWYPNVIYTSAIDSIYKNDYGIHLSPKASDKVQDLIKNLEDKDLSIINISWSIGFCFWILAIFAYISWRRKGLKSLLAFVPIFGIWLTMLIASPVFAEFRYVYGAFVCLPLLLIYPFLPSKLK